MKTRYVTAIAVVMVLLSTAVIMCIPHDNNSDETIGGRENYGFFLDEVKDGDGFGPTLQQMRHPHTEF